VSHGRANELPVSLRKRAPSATDRVVILDVWGTDLYCDLEYDDVHYEQVTRYRLEGKTLTLFTSTQLYVLERYPHCPSTCDAPYAVP
jgi:hypothetical protein